MTTPLKELVYSYNNLTEEQFLEIAILMDEREHTAAAALLFLYVTKNKGTMFDRELYLEFLSLRCHLIYDSIRSGKMPRKL